MTTECCRVHIEDDQRFCPKCGYEARVRHADRAELMTMLEPRLDYITAMANSNFASSWNDLRSALLTLLMELDAQRRRAARPPRAVTGEPG
jgi:hypothetical protein